MKIKKYIRIVVIMFIFFTIISYSLSPYQYASTGGVMEGAQDFINAGKGGSTLNEENMRDASNLIYNTLLIVGTVIAVIVMFALAIKFMVGSVEEKADTKKTMIAFIIGCCILYGSFGIWKIVLNLTKGIDDATVTSSRPVIIQRQELT